MALVRHGYAVQVVKCPREHYLLIKTPLSTDIICETDSFIGKLFSHYVSSYCESQCGPVLKFAPLNLGHNRFFLKTVINISLPVVIWWNTYARNNKNINYFGANKIFQLWSRLRSATCQHAALFVELSSVLRATNLNLERSHSFFDIMKDCFWKGHQCVFFGWIVAKVPKWDVNNRLDNCGTTLMAGLLSSRHKRSSPSDDLFSVW